MDLTTKQLQAFLEQIHVRNTTKNYYELSAQAKLHGAEMNSTLEEILGVTSEESAFAPEQNAAFERRALELLEERQRMQSERQRTPN